MELTTLPGDAPGPALAETIHFIRVPAVWVLLWSQSQNALHVETLEDLLRKDADAFAEDRRMDYVPLHIGSRDAVDEAAKRVRPICYARAESRAATRERV